MIHIICDFEQLDQSAADYIIDSTAQYIEVRQAIQRYLDNDNTDRNLVIVVHNQVIAKWLEDLQDYGSLIIDWQTTNINERFQDRFGISMPSLLSTHDIVEHKILDWSEASIDQNNIEGSILARLLSEVWRPIVPTNSHFQELVQWSVSAPRPPQSLFPLMGFKLDHWKNINKKYGILSVATLQDISQQLITRWFLRGYPDSFVTTLGLEKYQKEECLNAINHDDVINILSQYKRPIIEYWGYRFSEISSWVDAINEAIRVMSGFAEAELYLLSEFAARKPENITFSVVHTIQSKFIALPSLNNNIARLKALVPLDVPTMPKINVDQTIMLDWIEDKYMPYFEWVIRSGYDRTEQIQLSNEFAEWLYTNYREYIYDANSPLITNLLATFREYIDPNHVVFWVIVDGMTWWEGTLLAKLCIETKLSIIKMIPKIAALPSITSISKKAMVRGYLESSDGKMATNGQAAIEELKKHYGTAFVGTDIKTLRSKLNNEDTGIFLWFYNELDTHHHKADEIGDEVTEGYLKRVLREIQEVTESCKKRGVDIDVFVSSDHGCTRLTQGARRLEIPKFATEWDEDEPELDTSATRACSIANDVSSKSLDNLSNDWFVLQKDLFNLPSHFIVPKHYDYVGRRPKGWTHGGLSPEEVVVPFIHLQDQKITITNPRIAIQGTIRANFMSIIKVEVTNPNDFDLRKVSLTIEWIENQVVNLDTITSRKMISRDIELPARALDGKDANINYIFSYSVHGQENIISSSAKLPIRRLMVNSIDDMFEK